MKNFSDLNKHKAALQLRYKKLIERYNSYKHVDESISDIACYKALKTLKKLNNIEYLENS